MWNMIPNRIVIDTNVCLDLFFFRDPRWEKLMCALRDGQVEAVTRSDCRNEWLIVLGYSHLGIGPDLRPDVAARFDAAITCLPHDEPVASDIRLPLCKDTDDQKFLELARDAGAAVLLTKDKALLKLARRTAKAGLFRIMHPDAWIQSAFQVQEATETTP
jgi:predicted nucleic acid-binding protein